MIGQRLKELRKSRRITQTELSERINISQSTLANFENEKRTLPIDILIKIAQYFDVSTDYILGLSEVSELSTDNNFIHYVYDESLSEDEKKLVETYRHLNSDEQKIVLGKALDLKLSHRTYEDK